MLSLLVMLATPQSVIPTLPLAPPVVEPRMPVFGAAPFGCADELTTARYPHAPGGGLMWREDGDAVGLYRLLDRRVNGCPAPLIVNYRVPGSNALGRELGRAAPPPSPPVTIRRPRR